MTDAMKAVLGRKLPAREKSVLNVYGARADKEGYAWPGIDTVASDTGLHRSTVIRAIESLVEMGELIKIEKGGGRRSTTYQLGCMVKTMPLFTPKPVESERVEKPKSKVVRGTAAVPPEDTAAVAQRDGSCSKLAPAIRKESTYNNHGSGIEPKAHDGDSAADARAPFLLECVREHFHRKNGYDIPPAHEFNLSGAIFAALLNLPLPYWTNDKLADAVANFFASERSKRNDPMAPPGQWVYELYRYRDGPLDRYGKPIEFTDAQEAHGSAIEIFGGPAVPDNAHFRRTANNFRATARAFQYFDRLEQAQGDHGGAEPPGGSDPRDG